MADLLWQKKITKLLFTIFVRQIGSAILDFEKLGSELKTAFSKNP